LEEIPGLRSDILSHDEHPGFTVAKMCIDINPGSVPNPRGIPASVLTQRASFLRVDDG
jgi:hypothetical protein